MSARVFGSIVDAATTTLITNASVTATPYTVTCAGGAYSFVTPGAATVTVVCSAPNYITQSVPLTLTNGQLKNLAFALVHV